MNAENLNLVNSGYVKDHLNLSRQRLHQLKRGEKIRAFDLQTKGGRRFTVYDLNSIKEYQKQTNK